MQARAFHTFPHSTTFHIPHFSTFHNFPQLTNSTLFHTAAALPALPAACLPPPAQLPPDCPRQPSLAPTLNDKTTPRTTKRLAGWGDRDLRQTAPNRTEPRGQAGEGRADLRQAAAEPNRTAGAGGRGAERLRADLRPTAPAGRGGAGQADEGRGRFGRASQPATPQRQPPTKKHQNKGTKKAGEIRQAGGSCIKAGGGRLAIERARQAGPTQHTTY